MGDDSKNRKSHDVSSDASKSSIPDSEQKINPSEKNSSENLGKITRKVFKIAKDTQKNTEEIKKAADSASAESAVEKSNSKNKKINRTNSNGERFSIVELDNGMQYVKATESQVITGTDPVKLANQVANYINNKIRGGKDFVIKTTQGDFLTITRETAHKAGFRNDVRNPDGTYRQMTDNEYRTKLNAEVHINELAEVSLNPKKPPVPDQKKHSFAKNGFTYRTAYFEDFDGEYYKLTISVGENGNVSTVYNVGKIKKDSLPSGKIVSTFSGSKANSKSSKSSIPDSEQKINPSEKNSSEKLGEISRKVFKIAKDTQEAKSFRAARRNSSKPIRKCLTSSRLITAIISATATL